MKQIQEHEQALHELKQKLEQAQINAQYEISAFEASKERELLQTENRQRHEIELCNIELQGIQSATESLRERHQRRMSELVELQRTRMDALELEFASEKTKIENVSQDLITQKEKLIFELKVAIKDSEAEMKGRGPLPEDTEHIARLEEIATERREAVERLASEYRMYETAMIDSEASFNRFVADQNIGRSDSGPSLLGSVGGKRLRKDILTISGRKVPNVIEPSNVRKNRTPV
jgi:hypothetical protein